MLITLYLLRPLARLKQRALQLIADDADVEAGWPDLGGELGELSQVLQHVMRERQASQAAGQLLLAKMRAVMAKAPVGIAFTRNRRFELVSDEFNRLLGYEGSGLDGEAARVIYASDEFYQGLGTRVAAAFGVGRVFAEEIEFVRRDGSRFWGQLLGAPVSRNDAGAGTIWTLGDISEERRKRNALSWAATHDALTNIANRQEFESRLAEHLDDRRRREVACVLYVDLDGFKAVNDAAGHAAGDQLLRDIAALLLARIRSIDLAARLGGDEFAILLQACALPTALNVAEQIRARVDSHSLVWQGQHFRRRRQHRRGPDRRRLRRRRQRHRRRRRRLLRRQARRPQPRPQRRTRACAWSTTASPSVAARAGGSGRARRADARHPCRRSCRADRSSTSASLLPLRARTWKA